MIIVIKNYKEKFLIAGCLIIGAMVVSILFGTALRLEQSDRKRAAESMYKIGASRALEIEGKKLLKQGKLEEALKKFAEANSPKYALYKNLPHPNSSFYMREIYFLRGEYERALNDVNQILAFDYIQKMLKIENEVGAHHLMEEKLEYEALIRARDTKSSKPIYDHIDYLKKNHAAELPPNGYDPIASLTPISTLLRLYDTIGDYDSGIRFVDEILDWAYKKDDEEIGLLKDRIRTSEEATECMALDRATAKEKNLDHMACKWLREYLLVREAFEQDKAEGARGRATRALIQSDYFPW